MNNMKAVISQRLKLAEQDLEGKDLDTVLSRVIKQNRRMTDVEVEIEKAQVVALYEQSRAAVANIHEGSTEFFRAKIRALDITAEERLVWTCDAARRVLALENTGEVGPSGFIPKVVRQELQLLVEKGTDVNFTEDRVVDLLIFCMGTLAMTTLCAPRAAEGVADKAKDDETNVSEEALALKAIKALQKAGKLNAHWDGMTESKIAELLYFARNDATVHESNESLIRKMTELYVAEFISVKTETGRYAVEQDAEDLKARHLLAVAILRNLQATGELPQAFAEMNPDDLALLAYSSTEMNYYFNEAAAGKMSVEEFFSIAFTLAEAAFCALLGLLILTEGSFIGVVGFIMLAISAMSYTVDAIEQLMETLFPAGVAETRLGVSIRAGVDYVCDFAATLLAKLLTFGSVDSDNNRGNDEGNDEVDNEDNDEDNNEDNNEVNDEDNDEENDEDNDEDNR